MIYVIGIGPGDPSYGLLGQEAYFEKADRILGSERQDEEILYLASGDPLIYGLGKWLSEKFKGRVVISPGISAMQYLASRIALPMNDAYLTSSHAKEPNFDLIMSLSKVFMVTDQKVGPYEIAQEAVKRGLDKVLVIGEQLSYEDERITILPASEVEDREYEMNVVVVLDEGFGIYQG